ncbi:hypothetical protein PAXRUDRAFT_22534 [Paxillus rubicundulus Ve08.2h10]|uniref:Uncharacterized protein n=1 Tax=Paxillus rubicundulus Ve08.2h10 TaxID=930991 RepID=A0A0D0C8R3_9AGAM|nr:hypothetical protein PAXRUDRAFT_22534 [Paxillus rubicundulus Ve08.2h10]
MTTQYDINDQIEDGEAFNGWGGAHQRRMEYAKKALGDLASDGAHPVPHGPADRRPTYGL